MFCLSRLKYLILVPLRCLYFQRIYTTSWVQGCWALHGAPAERPFYTLSLNDAQTAIDEVAYLCTNASCSDCLISSGQFNECIDMGDSMGTSVSFRQSPPDGSFLPSASSGRFPLKIVVDLCAKLYCMRNVFEPRKTTLWLLIV